jgi:molybdenum cofactor cytidylyltransferase
VSRSQPARIGCIVLAAGQSTRLGQPKQLLLVSGRPLLERTLDLARGTAFEPRIVVLGAYADDVERAINLRGWRVVRNPRFADGQATSLRAGLDALPADVDGAVVLLGDQPLVPSWLIDELTARFDPNAHVAVRPRYADGPGNPVLLGRELFPELLALAGDVGAREVLRRHAGRIAELDISARPAPRDVDTLEDYQQLLLDWAALGAPDVPRYCQRCAAEVGVRELHARWRPVCPQCGFTYFFDPKIAAAVVVEIDGRIVLQQRTIDPGMGRWTFAGGFVDRGEPVHVAAVREVREEIGIEINDPTLLGVYSEPGEMVVLVAFAASAPGQRPSIGDESSDVRLFDPDDLPELAFHRDARVLADWKRAHKR